MLAEVRRFMRREAMPSANAPMWVAVSGGVDSMVLLHVLRELGHACHVAHVDHGLRGEESDADRRFVEEFAQAHKLPFRSVRVDVKARLEGISVQMAARELRYAWFNELLFEGPSDLALGHHRDDALETLFLNLLRGTGAHGWAGIRPVTEIPGGRISRPLLAVGREEIGAYAKANNIPFREDPSNADPKYLRNRVRGELVPFLEELRPGSRTTLARATEWLREMTAAADQWTEREAMDIVPDADGVLRIPVQRLRSSPAPRLLLHRLLRGRSTHPELIEQMLDAMHGGSVGTVFHMGKDRITVDRTHLILDQGAGGFPSFTINLAEDEGGAGPFHWELCEGGTVPKTFDAHTAWFDPAKLAEPLVLRPWKQGDRMRPLGLGGSKLISDLLIDAKVPRNEKPGIYVLESAGSIAWLVGHRIAEAVSPTGGSAHVLRVTHGGAAGSP
jgi:tRNA(Ile)-lysidine synthase